MLLWYCLLNCYHVEWNLVGCLQHCYCTLESDIWCSKVNLTLSSLYVSPRSSTCLDTWNVFAVKIENFWAGAHASGDLMKFIRQKKLLLRIGIQCRVKPRTVTLGNGLEERQSRMTARTCIGVAESSFERHPVSGSRSTFLRGNIQRYTSLATMYSQYLFPLS